MFLGILFIFLSVFFGLNVLIFLKISFTTEERLALSILIGLPVATVLVYLVSYWQGRLDLQSILAVTGMITIFTLLIFKWKKISFTDLIGGGFNFEKSLVLIVALLAFTFLNFRSVLMEMAGGVYSQLYVRSDICFHTSIINSFVYRNNFPPQYPIMIDTPMNYNILIDFLSAVLIKMGFDLRSSIIIPNILFQASTLCLIAALALRMVKKRYSGFFSAFLFFFAGNMGILYAFRDMTNVGFTNWIMNLPTDYSGSGISKLPEIQFGNPIAVMLMPQRASMLGLGIALAVYILIVYSLKNKNNFRELVFAGFLMGLLPTVHTHSFIAVFLVSLFSGLIFRKNFKFFAFLFLPAIILSLPQILIIQTQVGASFLGLSVGWLNVAKTNLFFNGSNPFGFLFNIFVGSSLFVNFWILNLGALTIFLLIGFFRSGKTLRLFYLPFIILFFLGNFVRFQPWNWDNYKIFVHWYILTVVLASRGIIELVNFALTNWKTSFRNFKQKLWKNKRLKALVASVAVVGLLFFSIGSGFLSHFYAIQHNYLVWSKSDIAFAEWIKVNTDSKSIFLTSTTLTHPVFTLAGRQIVLGYGGWLWSHGLDETKISEVRSDVIEMFKGNYTLLVQYGVDYISVTDYERDFSNTYYFEINSEFFMNSVFFRKVYDETLNGKQWMIFKVL